MINQSATNPENFVKIAQGIRPCGGRLYSKISLDFHFWGPRPTCAPIGVKFGVINRLVNSKCHLK